MKDKVIEKLHRIREEHYEETKDLSREERLERINRSGEEFRKLLSRIRQEEESGIEVSMSSS